MWVKWFMPYTPEDDNVFGVILEITKEDGSGSEWIPSSLPVEPLEFYRMQGPEYCWTFVPEELIVFDSLQSAEMFLYDAFTMFRQGFKSEAIVTVLALRHGGRAVRRSEFYFADEKPSFDRLN